MEIILRCAECWEVLEDKMVVVSGVIHFEVQPCARCVNDATQTGYDDGFERGRDEERARA